MERVLFIWAIRHPASGYVQGLNDLICPFMMVFFSEHVRHGEKFENIDVKEIPEEAIKQVCSLIYLSWFTNLETKG